MGGGLGGRAFIGFWRVLGGILLFTRGPPARGQAFAARGCDDAEMLAELADTDADWSFFTSVFSRDLITGDSFSPGILFSRRYLAVT